MVTYGITKLFHQRRVPDFGILTNSSLNSIFPVSLKYKVLQRCISHVNTEQKSVKSWYPVRQWKWTFPIGAGISLFVLWQWKYFRKDPQLELEGPFSTIAVKCYCCLPLRITSRVWGWIASREVPIKLRPALYKFYAKTFHANLNEIELDLSSFPSLVDFFVRPLKDNVRPIAQNSNIVSPSDGTVLYLGPVTSCSVQQVKGVTYNLQHFLGDINLSIMDQAKQPEKDSSCDYINTLLKNPLNQLYQLTVYLAPGDYHRFHSSADWEIEMRRHFQGKLLSVNPKIAKYLPDLFSLNERVVYIGTWEGGFMAYAAVGATNVGSIRVYCDHELTTNTFKWFEPKYWQDSKLGCTRINKGELFGEFRMGSTIVLLFEAPTDIKFCIKVGQSIKVGQALSECDIKPLKRTIKA